MLELGSLLSIFSFLTSYGAYRMAVGQRASDELGGGETKIYALTMNDKGDLRPIKDVNTDSNVVKSFLWVSRVFFAIGCIGILLIAAHFMSVIFSSIK